MEELWIRVWNVGRGNAISLGLPNGKLVMIDAGASEDCSPVSILNSKYGFKTVDTLVITHPHSDHMADLDTIFKLRMGPTVLIRPRWVTKEAILNGNSDKDCVNSYLVADNSYVGVVSRDNDIYQSTTTGGVIFKQYSTSELSDSDLNNASIVHLVEYCGKKIMFPGDCTTGAMKKLLEKTSLKQDVQGLAVLVAPHHGHESCYCPELMKEIKPSLCIVSEGHGGEDENYVDSRYSNSDNIGGLVFTGRNGSKDVRKCITTRKDGNIDIMISVDNLHVRYGYE